jgi:curved DNA-binding protein CbpA
MSITKRILDVARSNLNALLEKAAEQADPRKKLSGVSDAELEAELSRRRSARADQARVDEAKARVDAPTQQPPPAAAGSGGKPNPNPNDRAERERQAREREAKVRAARDARAQQQASSSSQQQRQRASSQQQPPPRGAKVPRGRDPMIAQYYERLELPYGASWDEVKAAFRRLMRKYHPDLHAGNPEKLKAATEVSQALTQAYNELEKFLLHKS